MQQRRERRLRVEFVRPVLVSPNNIFNSTNIDLSRIISLRERLYQLRRPWAQRWLRLTMPSIRRAVVRALSLSVAVSLYFVIVIVSECHNHKSKSKSKYHTNRAFKFTGSKCRCCFGSFGIRHSFAQCIEFRLLYFEIIQLTFRQQWEYWIPAMLPFVRSHSQPIVLFLQRDRLLVPNLLFFVWERKTKRKDCADTVSACKWRSRSLTAARVRSSSVVNSLACAFAV